MGLSLRYFIIDDAGEIHPVPLTRYERIFFGKEAVPQYAGKKLRVAEVSVELVNGAPSRTLRDALSFLVFDDAGLVDQRFVEDYMRAANDTVSGAVLDKLDDARAGGILQAGGRFAKRRLDETFHWKPDYKLRQRILDFALEKPSTRTVGKKVERRTRSNMKRLRELPEETSATEVSGILLAWISTHDNSPKNLGLDELARS